MNSMMTFLRYLNIDADQFIKENIRMVELIGEKAFRMSVVLCKTEDEIVALMLKAK